MAHFFPAYPLNCRHYILEYLSLWPAFVLSGSCWSSFLLRRREGWEGKGSLQEELRVVYMESGPLRLRGLEVGNLMGWYVFHELKSESELSSLRS